jgi:DNA-binding transcriptional regulator YhcF (GntR family)
MKRDLDNERPLFLQIKEAIEEDILTGLLKANDQIPSHSQLVNLYGINPVTVHRGVSMLLDEGTVYKKRGLGMFVSPDALARLQQQYQGAFRHDYVEPLIRRARMLGITPDELQIYITESLHIQEPAAGFVEREQPLVPAPLGEAASASLERCSPLEPARPSLSIHRDP